jgi:hypothetical protein
MESPLRRNAEQGHAIVGVDRPRCFRLYPGCHCREANRSKRLYSRRGRREATTHSVLYLELTNRTSQHDETAYIWTNLVRLLKFCKDMDIESHLGAPAPEGGKIDAQGLFSVGFGALERWQWSWDNSRVRVRTVGKLAIEGKYATATQACAVLEIFSSTFFGLYEPNLSLVESSQLFFTNPHHVPHCQNLRGALRHPTAQDGLGLLTECAPFVAHRGHPLSTRRAARLIP